MADYERKEALSAGKSDAEKQAIIRECNNQVHPPLNVSSDPHLPNIYKSMSDILHTVKLGPNNNLLGALDHHFHGRMTLFYKIIGINRRHSGMIGSMWNGPQIDRIIANRHLLAKILPHPLGSVCSTFFKWSSKLYKTLAAVALDPEWRSTHSNYMKCFYLLNQIGYLSPTLKVHWIETHYPFLLETTGKTLRFGDCNPVEATHSALRRSERTHMTRTITGLGRRKHLLRFLNSITYFNSKNVGFLLPAVAVSGHGQDGGGGGDVVVTPSPVAADQDGAGVGDQVTGPAAGQVTPSPQFQIVIDPSLNTYNVSKSGSVLGDSNDNVGDQDTEHATGDNTAMKGSRSFDNAVLDKSKTGNRRQSLLERPQSNKSNVREMADSRGVRSELCSPDRLDVEMSQGLKNMFVQLS